jgi:uncharacterized protein (TIGR00661 family)
MTRKILYGVQGTGQGHISRARGIAHAFRDYDVDVTWLFSGRPKDKFFDMEPFGHFKHREGLTMVTEAGKMKYRKPHSVYHLPPLLGMQRALTSTPMTLLSAITSP